MKISFKIEYYVNHGETVKIWGNIPELGGGNVCNALDMKSVDGKSWDISADIDFIDGKSKGIEYHYIVVEKNTGRILREEWNGLKHCVSLSDLSKEKDLLTLDYWYDIPENNYYLSSAFTKAWMRHDDKNTKQSVGNAGNLIIKTKAVCNSILTLAVCGNIDCLGNWNPEKAMPMNDDGYPEWHANLRVTDADIDHLEYKFIFLESSTRKLVAWEDHDNRRVNLHFGGDERETIVVNNGSPKFNFAAWKGAGVAVPVFSLRSEKSFGIGDFGDLKRLIDWTYVTKQKLIQLLPIYDTTTTKTWTDSYPYNSISIYAIHPIYADLTQMGTLKSRNKRLDFSKKQKELNQLPMLDYEAVYAAKWSFFKQIFKQDRDKLFASDGYKQFYKDNEHWLLPYAAFCYLRDKYSTANFRQWPEYSVYNSEAIKDICDESNPEYDEVAINFFVQYHLHKQLFDAKCYAHSHGIALKGDIPIGISRDSVEAWTEPYLFNLDGQAGAPPDDFSVNGQNWGFPTYNWNAMSKDGYSWWINRLSKMEDYFDAYRIDHILGFFRIWEIPISSVHGLLGQFTPSLPLSVDEIRSFGFPFDEHKHARPVITDELLEMLWGCETEDIKQRYLEKSLDEGMYILAKPFDTQRKIKDFYENREEAIDSQTRDKLFSLTENLLFIKDKYNSNLYHPRISGLTTYAYKTLDEQLQKAYAGLYNYYFYERHNSFWGEMAMEKLPKLIASTDMLVCGEDLGMIPNCVPDVMSKLKILSLEVQRMPKKYGEMFGLPEEYPYTSVCTISTHDTSTLRGWWKENRNVTQAYYSGILKGEGSAPENATPDICEQIISQHLSSPSMLCVLSLQDWLSLAPSLCYADVEKERINIPSVPNHYWRFRMRITLEELLKENILSDKIKSLITNTNRG